MGLFLMDQPVAKIMILGRWSSDAFLDYIRPQVLEWTNQLSRDMIQNDSFFDAADSRRVIPSDPRTRTKAGPASERIEEGAEQDAPSPLTEVECLVQGEFNGWTTQHPGVGAEFTVEESLDQPKHQSTSPLQSYVTTNADYLHRRS
ncbi:hypothetical protein MHU86_17905 [Fragilaria crotonensis]|nr:hypothetical protein MHU86_17905 [Fragilaria crotonensis]